MHVRGILFAGASKGAKPLSPLIHSDKERQLPRTRNCQRTVSRETLR